MTTIDDRNGSGGDEFFRVEAVAPRTLKLIGELDVTTAHILRVHLERLAAESGPVHLDLSELRFMDSSGIGALLAAARDLGEHALVLGSPQDGVRQVIEITGIGETGNIFLEYE